MRNLSFIVSFCLFIAAGAFAGPSSVQVESIPGELVVEIYPSKTTGEGAQVFASILQRIQTNKNIGTAKAKVFLTNENFALIKLASLNKSAQASWIKELKKDSRIKVAEPNFIYRTQAAGGLTNDPMLDQLWSMHNTGQPDHDGVQGKVATDIGIFPLWQAGITGSSKIKVAVIDTGVALSHPDLVSNIWTNPGEVSDNGIDDDHNGFIDDIHGWDFVKNTANPNDDNSHGTHCSGVIGGTGNNGIGIVGVNWNVSIIPLKFLDQSGAGNLANAVMAIQYATKMGAQVMSNSWSGGGFSQALFDAITEARNQGILFVAAAGNNASNTDTAPRYPASYQIDNIVSVAATNNKDHLADFSNFGRNSVHVAAPGVDIWSAGVTQEYMQMSGTSMATPHVAGIAALMLSADPTLNYSSIKDLLIKTSVPIRGFLNKTISGGRVSAYNAVHKIIPVVSSPDESQWQDYNFAFESAHPYVNNFKMEKSVTIPGAKYIRVIVESYDTEANYDFLSVLDGEGNEIEHISGKGSKYVTDYLEGQNLKVIFSSDSSTFQYGFKISKIQVIY